MTDYDLGPQAHGQAPAHSEHAEHDGSQEHGAPRAGQEHGGRHRYALLARTELGFEWLEQLLILSVALFLVGFAVLSLVNVVAIAWGPIFVEHDYTKAIANGFDAAFMTVILLEVLHTVLSRAALATLVIEFLVIAITSAVRHSLEIAAAAGSEHEITQAVCGNVRDAASQLQHVCRTSTQLVANTSGQEIVLELMLNAGCVLLLVLALRLMHTIRPSAG